MALPSLATLEELTTRLPADVVIEDSARATAALEDASALVRDEAGVTWVDDQGALTTVPDVVRLITLEVAQRALNRSFVYGAEGEVRDVGGLYLKADERKRLNKTIGNVTSPGLWTLATTRSDDTAAELAGTTVVTGYDVPYLPS